MLSVTVQLLKGLRCVTAPLAPAVGGGETVGNLIRKPAAFMSEAACVFGQRGGAGTCVRHSYLLWEQHRLSWAAKTSCSGAFPYAPGEGHLGNTPGVNPTRSRGTPQCCKTPKEALRSVSEGMGPPCVCWGGSGMKDEPADLLGLLPCSCRNILH